MNLTMRSASDKAEQMPSKRMGSCGNLTNSIEGSLADRRTQGCKRKATYDAGPPAKRSRFDFNTAPSVVSDLVVKAKKRKANDDAGPPEKRRRCTFNTDPSVVSDRVVKAKKRKATDDDGPPEKRRCICNSGLKLDLVVFVGGDVSKNVSLTLTKGRMICKSSDAENVGGAGFKKKHLHLKPISESSSSSVYPAIQNSDCSKNRSWVSKVVERRIPKKLYHFTPDQEEAVRVKEKGERKKVPVERKDALLRTLPRANREDVVCIEEHLRSQQVKLMGFPNPVQICYMNACLQSLLTLKDFVRDVNRQEQVWRLTTEAAIMRSLIDLERAHFSSNQDHKLGLLASFKRAVSAMDEEFRDLEQKDAHEFLTSVLNQMKSLHPPLQQIAASMGSVYSCPVEDNLVFKMQSTRTCKSCGAGSTRLEEYTSLSLDILPGGATVEQLLENYFEETDLDYECQCGGTTSRQRVSFASLPKVLVLHLKRFSYTATYQLRKVCEPVVLFRDLVVSSNQGGGCFSLISSIDHIGPSATRGHYICDGVDPDVGQEDLTDRWYTYDDEEVTQTSGDAVCAKRQRDSYILFYQRID